MSVIIPCRNEQHTITRVLDALAGQTYPVDRLECLLVDGFSTDATREAIRSWSRDHPDFSLRIIDNPEQKIPHALNLGFSSAKNEILLRMDAHSIPQPDYVQRCVDGLESGQGESIGGQWIVRPGNDSRPAAAIAFAAGHPIGSGGASYRSGGRAGPADTVPYGCFTRETFAKVGGFNEALLANEDYEWNARLRKTGGVVYFDPAIRCTYFARQTYRQLWRQYANYGYWKVQMLRRNPGTLRLRQVLPALFAFFLALSALVSIAGLIAGWPQLASIIESGEAFQACRSSFSASICFS